MFFGIVVIDLPLLVSVKELFFPKTNSLKTSANPLICLETQKNSKDGAKMCNAS
jgi:hypothetical protein